MAMKEGEIYRCSKPDCGCEIRVTRGSQTHGHETPRCCCGHPMMRADPGASGFTSGSEGNEAVAR